MKTITIVALGLALGVVACSEPPPPPPKPVAKAVEIPKPAPQPEAKPEPPKPDPNKELAAKVKQTLEAPDSKLPSGAIDVTAQDGKVTLWGAVPSPDMKSRAGSLASKVQGVSSVDNQLKIVRGS
jgi:outer membrane biosynthesis protein TonB